MTTITDINRTFTIRASSDKKPASKPGQESSTSISESSTLLAQAEELAFDTPEIDEARVAEAREAIQKGEISINYERLAQKMLEYELNLFDD